MHQVKWVAEAHQEEEEEGKEKAKQSDGDAGSSHAPVLSSGKCSLVPGAHSSAVQMLSVCTSLFGAKERVE